MGKLGLCCRGRLAQCICGLLQWATQRTWAHDMSCPTITRSARRADDADEPPPEDASSEQDSEDGGNDSDDSDFDKRKKKRSRR